MIVLIRCAGSGSPVGWNRWEDGYSGPLWNEVRDLAIGQLERSSAGGPKKLKVVSLWGGDKFGPELAVEEVIV